MVTVRSKGQVLLSKKVREAAGIRPGDEVEVRNTASGGVYIEKPGAASAYRKRLEALARRLIRGATTDDIMLELRGDPSEEPLVFIDPPADRGRA